MRVKVVPIIIGALGTVPKDSGKEPERIGNQRKN